MTQVDGWVSMPARVLARAAANPQATAITQDGETLTYGALAERITRFAALLAGTLDGPEPLVAVCLERTPDLPAWLLAVLCAGGAYLPLDAALPPQRTAQVLRSAGAAVILASRSCLGALPAGDLPILIAEDLAAQPAPARSPLANRPRDLAYVMYTSGSTGEPKGVEIEHAAITTLFDAIVGITGLEPGKRLLATTRIGFDMSVVELFLPLTIGAEIVLVQQADAADPLRLRAIIEESAPDLLHLTPAAFRALLEAGWPAHVPSVIMCGGEAMSPDLAAKLRPRCGRLWNAYGPTEATVWSTMHEVADIGSIIPVGRAIAGTSALVLDDALQPATIGTPGEIVIASPSVARGYRRDPILTAARFVTLDDGRRAYRTGDIGRFDGEGVLFCHGRSDDQVKVRGFRIELGDVENALGRFPEVGWAAARTWTAQTDETTLVGYVVWRPGMTSTIADLTGFLRELLPPHMIPDRFMVLDRLPQNANGKIDRRALPSPLVHSTMAEAPATASRTPVEEWLAALWSEILSVGAIGPDDDFFELGGYSLLTVRLQRRIEERYGRVLDLPQLLRAPTLRAMAALIESDPGAGAENGIMLLDGPGTSPPLYWLDAGPLLREFARAMPAVQPVATLNVLRADEARFGTGRLDLAAVAAVLRERLLQALPNGPIALAGWCRWGIVAHELACQLQQQGREVGLLVLLDAEAPRRAVTQPVTRLRRWFTPAQQESFSQRVEIAARTHRARRFDGRTLLVRPFVRQFDRGGWNRIVAQLAIEAIPGDHMSMLRGAGAAALADAIVRHLPSDVPAPTIAEQPQTARTPVQAPVMPMYRAPASLPLLAATSEPIRAPLAERTTRLIE